MNSCRIIFIIVHFHMQVILGEEVAFSKLTLKEIISKICDGVQARAAQGLYNSLAVLS